MDRSLLPACGSVLLVSCDKEDRASVESALCHSGFKLTFTGSFQEARAILHDRPIDVVIYAGQSGDGHGWKDLLRELQDNAARTRLVVADRLADELLWAEVLNCGGYDLLLKPFDSMELFHVVNLACAPQWCAQAGAGET